MKKFSTNKVFFQDQSSFIGLTPGRDFDKSGHKRNSKNQEKVF